MSSDHGPSVPNDIAQVGLQFGETPAPSTPQVASEASGGMRLSVLRDADVNTGDSDDNSNGHHGAQRVGLFVHSSGLLSGVKRTRVSWTPARPANAIVIDEGSNEVSVSLPVSGEGPFNPTVAAASAGVGESPSTRDNDRTPLLVTEMDNPAALAALPGSVRGMHSATPGAQSAARGCGSGGARTDGSDAPTTRRRLEGSSGEAAAWRRTRCPPSPEIEVIDADESDGEAEREKPQVNAAAAVTPQKCPEGSGAGGCAAAESTPMPLTAVQSLGRRGGMNFFTTPTQDAQPYRMSIRGPEGEQIFVTTARLLLESSRRGDDPEALPGLSPEQEAVKRRIVDLGESVLITGGAGTGKTVLLKHVINALRSKFANDAYARVAVTASTGIAAVPLGGTTVHSCFRTGAWSESVPYHIFRAKMQRGGGMRPDLRVLIIDEISALDGRMFDCLEQAARDLRGSSLFFGGVQVVLCGDFLQLPPVSKGGWNPATKSFQEPCYVFEGAAWKRKDAPAVCVLKECRRQENDTRFAAMLNEVRFGNISAEVKDYFRPRMIDCPEVGPVSSSGMTRQFEREPVAEVGGAGAVEPDATPARTLAAPRLGRFLRLNAKNEGVQRENADEFDRLTTPIHTYVASDSGTADKRLYLKDIRAPPELKLRVGARVMLLANVKVAAGLANGTLGTVVAFLPVATRDLADPMTETRLRLLKERHLPVVVFEGSAERLGGVVIEPREFDYVEDLRARTPAASRLQLPLATAWAVTIHKSQGMTLDNVRVDLGSCFERGQVYVALSRVRSLASMTMVGFFGAKIVACPKARAFYEKHRPPPTPQAAGPRTVVAHEEDSRSTATSVSCQSEVPLLS